MSAPQLAIAAATGYLAGSIPWGILLAKLSGAPDPRTVGSGNIGATNVTRAGGLPLGIATLALDAAKAFAPAAAFAATSREAAAVAALAALVGHCWSPWLRFRGGKGVAPLLGGAAALAFPWGIAAFAVSWAVLAAATRYVSVASMGAAWCAAAATCLTGRAVPEGAALGVGAALVTVRHAGNIRRLARGEERRLFSRASAPP